MKRIFLATILLLAGGACILAVNAKVGRARQQVLSSQADWQVQTQRLAQIEWEQQTLIRQVRESKQTLRGREANPLPDTALALLYEKQDVKDFSPEMRERLMDELGLNWRSSDEFIVVSKSTLGRVHLTATKGNRLTDAVCGVLAITPEERAGVEARMQEVSAAYKSWAELHVRREEPAGDIVAKYTLPTDPEFSQSLSNTFAGGIATALGQERGELLRGYSLDWMNGYGLLRNPVPAKPTKLTVKRGMRPGMNGEEMYLGFDYEHSGSSMYTHVSPWQPFPEAFRALFPGGWAELARREGFDLPKEFEKKQE